MNNINKKAVIFTLGSMLAIGVLVLLSIFVHPSVFVWVILAGCSFMMFYFFWKNYFESKEEDYDRIY